MAAGRISKPGKEYGPCEGECHHTACMELRKIAAAACTICGEAIGYGHCFYREADNTLVHADCAEHRLHAWGNA